VKKRNSRQSEINGRVGSIVHLPDLSTLQIQLPLSLVQSIRLHAALDAKTLEDFVREAIEELLRG
jgi:hypothetical protein